MLKDARLSYEKYCDNSGLTQKDVCRISCTAERVFELTAYQGAFLSDVKITETINVSQADNLKLKPVMVGIYDRGDSE
jgi:hypothetical protein